jgi:DNA repair exonuclease SbcCD nuclease subunit
MIRFLHTADLHLDAPFPALGGRSRERQAVFLETFERILTLAIKSEVHLLLIVGDLFDSTSPSTAVIGQVQAGLKRLADRGIVPVLLPGTHDSIVSADSVYRRHRFPGVLLDRSAVEDPVKLTVNGEDAYLYGFAYRTLSSEGGLTSMSRRFPEGVHIGLLHGSRQGSPEWDYRKKDLPFTLPLLKDWGLDYVALGHYHQFEVLCEEGRIHACYPGSPEGKRFGENGARCCALVTIEAGEVQVERLPTNGQILEEKSLDLSGCDTEEAAVGAIRALGRPDLLLRLALGGIVEAPLDLAALKARCEGEFFYLELEDRTRLFDSEFARRIEQEETIRGVFVRRIRQLMDESPAGERAVVEEAFREVLVRFNAFSGRDL